MSGLEPDQVKTKMKKVKPVIDEALRIPGRPALPSDPSLPSSVVSTRKLATTAGWDAELIYARGITSTPKLVHIYALRMTRRGNAVTATWYAEVVEGKLTWKLSYSGMLGAWISQKGDVKRFPFTLSSDEMKGVLKSEHMTRLLVMDNHYDTIENGDKEKYFIPEREFRAPYVKVRAPRKTKAELIADDEMDMVLG